MKIELSRALLKVTEQMETSAGCADICEQKPNEKGEATSRTEKFRVVHLLNIHISLKTQQDHYRKSQEGLQTLPLLLMLLISNSSSNNGTLWYGRQEEKCRM